MDEPRARAREHRAGGVPLVRHRRGAAAGALGDLADLRLREQDDVEPDLPARGSHGSQGAAQGRRPASRFVCHGHDRLLEPELRREPGRHFEPSSPNAASVPAAPPSCAGSRTAASRSRGVEKPGRASPPRGSRRSSVPPAGGASAPRRGSSGTSSASRAHSAAAPASSLRISVRAFLATSIAAVSSTSWLVAPRCTSARLRARAARGRAAPPGSPRPGPPLQAATTS